jgi:hypothetical protein
VFPQGGQHRPAVEIGHHYVESNGGRLQLVGQLEPFNAAGCGYDGETFGLEMVGYQVARGGVVVNDQNATGMR